MADGRDRNKPGKKAPRKGRKGGDPDSKVAGRDLRSGKRLADKYLPQPDLIEVAQPPNSNLQNMANLSMARADPTNPGAYVGTRSSSMMDAIRGMQGIAQGAGQRSADMSQVINQMRGGLDGYTSAENQGMREQQTREMNTATRGALEQAQQNAGRNRLLGGAAAAQQTSILQDDAKQRRQLEQDLMVQNADEKQRRLEGFQNTLGGLEQQEFDNRIGAQDAYTKTLGGAEQDEYSRSREAMGDAITAGQAVESSEVARAGQINDARSKEAAVRAGAITGAAGMVSGERTARNQNRLMGTRVR